MQDEVVNTILKELREFRTEENKRWDENNKHWEENDKRWNTNDKRLASLENATKENTEAISKLNKHVYKDVFDSMRKMIYTFSLNEIVKGWKQSKEPIYKLYQLVYYSKKYWRQPVSKKLLRLSRLG